MNAHDERAGRAVAVVERRRVGAVVRHPPRCRRAGRQAPAVDEVRVMESARHEIVRDEVVDRVRVLGVDASCIDRYRRRQQ